VHAALAYYHADQEAIEADIAQEEAAVADWESQLARGQKGDEPGALLSRRRYDAWIPRLRLESP